MFSSIIISYTPGNNDPLFSTTVYYKFDLIDNIETLSCAVGSEARPSWLRSKKFLVQTLRSNGNYEQLYNEANYTYSADMALFIDKVYHDIMAREKKQTNIYSVV